MKIKSLLLVIISFITVSLYAQNVWVKGRIIDSAKNPIVGATITAKGISKGTQSDEKGFFSLKLNDAKSTTIDISFVGYKSKSIKTTATEGLLITLEKDINQLEDLVVVGYQTVRRKDVMASVASVDAKQLKDVVVNSAAEMLNGRLAGVTATTSEGAPDADVRVRVRGGMSITQDNTPLYVVDGVQVENALNVIAPQDIQSIDVLKDAAATSIYGARGANGVIIITTKAGKPGKLQVFYNGFVGIKMLANKLKVLSPYEYLLYNYEKSLTSSTDSATFRKNYGSFDTLINYINNPVVDWQKEAVGKTGFSQTHNIGFNGGNSKVTYNFSYTHNNDKAIVLNSTYKRHLLNLKGDYKISKNIKVGMGVRYTNQFVTGAGVSDEKGSSYNRLRNAVKYRPFLLPNQSLLDDDPFNPDVVGNNLTLTNPILLANSETRKKTTNAFNYNANILYNISKNISFRTTFGYEKSDFYDRQFSDSLSNYSIIQGAAKPIVSLDTTLKKVITNSNVFTYALKNYKKKHNITFILGEETYDLSTTSTNRIIENYPRFTEPDKAFGETSLGTTKGIPKFYKSRYTSISFFSRLNYAYQNKYIVEFNVRADGSSKFSPEQRWGYFPSGSLVWVASNEKFLKGNNTLNNLKFRLGYGTVGNNRFDDYLYLTTFRNDQYYYSLNGSLVPASTSVALVNENLKWESLINKNIGVDISLFKSRVEVSFDYYDNASKDLLLDVPIASTYGYASQLQNIGQTSNKGWELQINATLIKSKKNNFNWTANFNLSHNTNTVKALGKNMNYFYPAYSWGVSGQPTDYIVRIGDPVGAMWGLVTDGFYKVEDFNYAGGVYTLKTGVVNNTSIIGTPQPGMIKFKDLNGDGLVDVNNDRTIIGNPTPKFTGGINQQFTYKNWDASLFVNFSIGGDIYNANKIEFTNAYTPNANLLDIINSQNRWMTINAQGQRVTDPTALAALNANATIWRPNGGAGAFYPHSWAIEDGSFVRLNNVTLGYSFPLKSLVKLGISKLRVYTTANNLAVFTNYSGYDPEVSVKRSPLTPNLDYSAYPKSHNYTFGVNVIF